MKQFEDTKQLKYYDSIGRYPHGLAMYHLY